MKKKIQVALITLEKKPGFYILLGSIIYSIEVCEKALLTKTSVVKFTLSQVTHQRFAILRKLNWPKVFSGTSLQFSKFSVSVFELQADSFTNN